MDLLKRAQELQEKFIEFRRDFHRHPELGMEEVRTAKIVADFLTSLGLAVQTEVGGTGVVGLLRGGITGKTIAIRADMDALTILEQTNREYSSTIPGKMHACGHDGHTAILMGVAQLLVEAKDSIKGNVKFFFQPAEEGPGGALPMIEAGAMDNPTVDAAIGLHLNTVAFKTGEIGVKSGVSSAGTDAFKVAIRGKGGHGAHPHHSIDAIVAAGHFITAVQSIASREIDPLGSVVVTIGTINGGYRQNIIADEVLMTGTVRTLDPAVRSTMPERLERILMGICATFRCTHSLEFEHGYPSVVNDEQMAHLVFDVAKGLLGADKVRTIANPSMGGEDFSYFAERVPASFFSLGAGNAAKECSYPGHHPKYDFDEDAIPVGMAVLSAVALEYLNRN
jgi:amidohydrolase